MRPQPARVDVDSRIVELTEDLRAATRDSVNAERRARIAEGEARQARRRLDQVAAAALRAAADELEGLPNRMQRRHTLAHWLRLRAGTLEPTNALTVDVEDVE